MNYLNIHDSLGNRRHDYISPVQTVDAVDAKHSSLLANHPVLVHPAVANVLDELVDAVNEEGDVFEAHSSTKK